MKSKSIFSLSLALIKLYNYMDLTFLYGSHKGGKQHTETVNLVKDIPTSKKKNFSVFG